MEKFGKLSMDNVFMLLWVVVILAVMLVMILGQFLTTLLLGVAIVAYINKMSKGNTPNNGGSNNNPNKGNKP